MFTCPISSILSKSLTLSSRLPFMWPPLPQWSNQPTQNSVHIRGPSVYSRSVRNRSSVLEPKFPVGSAPGILPAFRLSGKGPSDVTRGTSTPFSVIRRLIASRYPLSLA